MISIPKIQPQADKVTGTSRYSTKEYADDVLEMLKNWERTGQRPMFVAADATGLSPSTLRVSFYLARAFMRDNAGLFSPEAMKLIESASFELVHKPIRGICIKRRMAAFDLKSLTMEVSTADQDHEAYQNLMAWISEPRENNDKYVIDGPFNLADYQRYKATCEQLRGMFLTNLTPQKITVIYHPGGK